MCWERWVGLHTSLRSLAFPTLIPASGVHGPYLERTDAESTTADAQYIGVQSVSYGCILWLYPLESSLARPPPRDADAPPPALPRMRSHALRPRRMGVPKELVGGALVEENGGHARLGVGVERRVITQDVVSCARHAKSKSAE